MLYTCEEHHNTIVVYDAFVKGCPICESYIDEDTYDEALSKIKDLEDALEERDEDLTILNNQIKDLQAELDEKEKERTTE